jgi:hypothetical protein
LTSLDAIVDARIEAKLARMNGSPFAWVRCGPSTISTKQAHALAKREGVGVTKIGKYVFVSRADLERIAAKNLVVVEQPRDEPDPLEGIDPAVAAVIRRAARGQA